MGLYTISTSESELMDRTYMVTPTLTAWPETQSYICGGQLIDHWSDWSDQLEARPCFFYPNPISILESWFYQEISTNLTLTYFYPYLQPILSWFAISQNPKNLLKFRRPSEKRIAKSANSNKSNFSRKFWNSVWNWERIDCLIIFYPMFSQFILV